MPEKRTRTDYWHDPDAPRPTSRKASASAFVRDGTGRLLLLLRTDNRLWTIPTGGVKKGETVAQAAVRECEEETGLLVEVTGLVGVFSDPTPRLAPPPTGAAGCLGNGSKVQLSACKRSTYYRVIAPARGEP